MSETEVKGVQNGQAACDQPPWGSWLAISPQKP